MPFSVPERNQARDEHTPAAPAVSSRAVGALPLAGTGARRSTTRLRPSRVPVVQLKLPLGGDNDLHEREADRLAEGLAATADTGDRAAAPASVTPANGSAGKAIDPSVQQVILDAQGQGRPVPGGERSRDEQFLGANFSGVRLHTDQRAAELNRHLGSSAFTAGQDIFFGHGEYDPASATGREVLDHELVHAAQQADGGTLVQLAKKRQSRPAKKGEETKEEAEEQAEKKKLAQQASARRVLKPGKQKAVEQQLADEELAEAAEAAEARRGVKRGKEEKSIQPWQQPKRGKKQRATTAPSEVKVDYYGQDEMAKRLGLVEPAADYKPQPVQVGVVVWNINHLKQEDDDNQDTKAEETEDQGGQAAIADVLKADEESEDELPLPKISCPKTVPNRWSSTNRLSTKLRKYSIACKN